ncbi:DUF5615 family PIN-like protein [Haloplanus halophilus]|uniref:DUF5615 family PIN-like protein n=1 Tax=Haloplanus halophilus TaxID=2949993 RepID=UPI00203C83E1|nr:DUF5615 family PIN-like protein [Haloplanus sp. GDY1]
MSVTLSLLFDEDTEAKFARLCEKEGHDVERVVDVPELGRGAKDAEVRRYANSTDRIVVTHDDDYVRGARADDDRTLYAPNQRLSAFELYRILSAVCDVVSSAEELPPAVYLTEDWL